MNVIHIPVLKNEVLEGLKIEPGKRYIDATLGAGGHTREMVRNGGIVLGIDQDQSALDQAKLRIEEIDKVTLVQGNFRDIEGIAKKHGFGNVSGILFDLGVSSMQLDTPERGFSYRFTDAPLDLRMDTSNRDTAAQLVNRATNEELYDIFSNFGEEELARKLADAVCRARSVNEIRTVGDLTAVVSGIVPNEVARYGVLSRVFQGLRIAINDEMGSLKEGLIGAQALLEPGGRLVVISFHSLEDRIVKRFMRQGPWDVVTKHPIRPTDEEAFENKRSRSAKLRIAIKKAV